MYIISSFQHVAPEIVIAIKCSTYSSIYTSCISHIIHRYEVALLPIHLNAYIPIYISIYLITEVMKCVFKNIYECLLAVLCSISLTLPIISFISVII